MHADRVLSATRSLLDHKQISWLSELEGTRPSCGRASRRMLCSIQSCKRSQRANLLIVSVLTSRRLCRPSVLMDRCSPVGGRFDGSMLAGRRQYGQFASCIIRIFQPEQYFSLTTNQPEQCFGLFFQRSERDLRVGLFTGLALIGQRLCRPFCRVSAHRS